MKLRMYELELWRWPWRGKFNLKKNSISRSVSKTNVVIESIETPVEDQTWILWVDLFLSDLLIENESEEGRKLKNPSVHVNWLKW